MACFAVFHESKQIKVYAYSLGSFKDRERAKRLAVEFSEKALTHGYRYTVEEFGLSGVGTVAWTPS